MNKSVQQRAILTSLIGRHRNVILKKDEIDPRWSTIALSLFFISDIFLNLNSPNCFSWPCWEIDADRAGIWSQNLSVCFLFDGPPRSEEEIGKSLLWVEISLRHIVSLIPMRRRQGLCALVEKQQAIMSYSAELEGTSTGVCWAIAS
jgi:hypothetical protein